MQERGTGPVLTIERRRATRLTLAVGFAVVVLDQVTKTWAVQRLSGGRVIDLIGSVRFRLTFNRGIAFNLGDGLGPVLVVVAVIVLFVFLRASAWITTKPGATAVGMVVGGALGNLADRAFRAGDGFLGGGVVDFIDPQFWPVFNVADVGVVGGAVLLAAVEMRRD